MADPAGSRFPLSHGQAGVWFFDELAPGNPAYNIPQAWRILGELDHAALERAYQQVVDRHEALRTGLCVVAGVAGQQIHDRVRAVLEITDLTALPPGEREHEVRQAARQEVSTPFDLAVPPLIRARLLILGDRKHHLLLTVHHIVADGWSIAVLLDELRTAYQAARDGIDPPFAPPKAQYRDYVDWQRKLLAGPERERLGKYWRNALAGAVPLELPADRARPAKPEFAGAVVPVVFPRALTSALKDLAKQHRATLFMVLAAGLQALFRRYTGEHAITIGTPVSRRPEPRFERVAGLFLTTVPLHVPVPGDPAFTRLLAAVREAALAGYAHADLPFEVIVTELGLPRDTSGNPLVRVLLTMQNTPVTGAEADGLVFRPVPNTSAHAKVDLELNLGEANGELRGILCYATSLFDHERIVRLREHLLTILAAAAARPDRRIGQLALLGTNESELIEDAGRGSRDYGPDLLPTLVAKQILRTPDAPAVLDESSWLTYRDFGTRVDRLARRLRAIGVGHGDVVGVCLERNADLVVTVHAILAVGAAYLPLAPEYPADRLRLMVDDAGARAVVTRTGSTGFRGIRTIRPDSDPAAVEAQDAPAPAVRVTAADLAYVIYTSGSTGRPKAVAVSHGAIANRIQWMQEAFPLDGADRVLHKTPFTFDVSVWELCWPLMAGATMIVAKHGGHSDPEYLTELIARERVTALHFVPGMAGAFLDVCERGRSAESVRLVFFSGEALTAALVRRLARTLPAAAAHNLYGPTEAAVDVSWQPCDELGEAATVPIGRPIANTRLEVLDAGLQRLPVGVPGELYIGGTQLARGYLNQPALTAQRFVPDPYGPPGARLYRTGDVALRQADGRWEFLGRVDHQVKLNGQRIEPGEVEAVLDRQPELRESVVIATDRLVAYLVPQPDLRAAVEKIDWAARLRGVLPAFLVPSAYVVLPALPITSNGKLDRAALPAPVVSPAAPDDQPRTPAQTAVAEAWQEVLGLNRIGARDNFFAVSGDSIRAIAVVSRLRRAGWQLSLADLLANPVVADLAEVLRPAPAEVRPRPSKTPFHQLSAADRQRLAPTAKELST